MLLTKLVVILLKLLSLYDFLYGLQRALLSYTLLLIILLREP